MIVYKISSLVQVASISVGGDELWTMKHATQRLPRWQTALCEQGFVIIWQWSEKVNKDTASDHCFIVTWGVECSLGKVSVDNKTVA